MEAEANFRRHVELHGCRHLNPVAGASVESLVLVALAQPPDGVELLAAFCADPGRAGLALGGFAELPDKKEQPGPAAPFAFLNGE